MVWSPPMATRARPSLVSVLAAVLDLLEGLGNAKRGARHVARVDDLDGGKGLHVEVRVIGAHQARGLAHGLRPETCSRTVGGPGVKGNAEDRDVPRLHLPDPG